MFEILASCMSCQVKFGTTCEYKEMVQIREEGFYRIDCPRGGITLFTPQSQHFEMWFGMAVDSYLKGQFDSSILRSYTALERFFEFAVNFYVQRIFSKTETNSFSEAWSSVGRQSERQFGALLALTELHNEIFKDSQVVLIGKNKRDTLAATRNKVAHAGYIPKHSDAKLHISGVLETISNFLNKAGNLDRNCLHIVVTGEMYRVRKSIPTNLLNDPNVAVATGVPYDTFNIGSKTNVTSLDDFLSLHKRFTDRQAALVQPHSGSFS